MACLRPRQGILSKPGLKMIVVPEGAIAGLIGFEECVEAVERDDADLALLEHRTARLAVELAASLFGRRIL